MKKVPALVRRSFAFYILHFSLQGGCADVAGAAASHLSVPVLRLRVDRAEDFQVPLAAAPGFDDFRGDDVDEDLRDGTAVRIAVEVVRGVIPAEGWEKDERQEQVEAVVDDEQLPAGALDGRVVDEVLLGRVRADVAFQGEFAGDDFLDGD